MTEIRPASRPEYSAWLAGAQPVGEAVRPGLWSIPLRFPENPLRYSIAYVLVTGDGAVLIDPGYGSESNLLVLRNALNSIGLGVHQIRAVLVTHYHLDHWGNADRIAAESGCSVYLGNAELDWFSSRSLDDFSPRRMREWYSWLGAPDDLLEVIAETDDVQQPAMHDAPTVKLSDGDVVPYTEGSLRVIATPGHTDGHISFVHDGYQVLFGGDNVLPTVSTNVSLTPFSVANPLEQFQRSLMRLKRFASFEVLPAHQYRYFGLGTRIESMLQVVQRRLGLVSVLKRDDPEISAWEIAQQIPRKRRPWAEFDALSMRLGLGEAAAYSIAVDHRLSNFIDGRSRPPTR